MLRSYGKNPDGLTLIPCRSGRCMTWDVTVADTVAPSYLATTSIHLGRAAELAEARMEAKYTQLMQSYLFVPLAFETMGPINTQEQAFLADLGRLLGQISGNPREASFCPSVCLSLFSD